MSTQAPEAAFPVAGPPEPEFAVLGARPVLHAATPMLNLDLHVREPGGRPVYMVALRIQIMLEPARRTYDETTRERLVELFGPPERWSVTTRSLLWSQVDVLVPAFQAETTVAVPVACSYDMEVASAKYLSSLDGDEVPLALHFNGTVYYPADGGGLQMILLPWNRSIDFRMPVSVWRETIDHYYPDMSWISLQAQTVEALSREKRARHLPTMDACVNALLKEPGDG